VAGQRRERAVDVLPLLGQSGRTTDGHASLPTCSQARDGARPRHRSEVVSQGSSCGVSTAARRPPVDRRRGHPPARPTTRRCASPINTTVDDTRFPTRSKAGHDVHCQTSCPPKSLLVHSARGPGPCCSRRAAEPIWTDATPRPRPRAARGRAAGPARRAGRRGGAPSSVVAGPTRPAGPATGAVPGAGGSRAPNRHLRHWRTATQPHERPNLRHVPSIGVASVGALNGGCGGRPPPGIRRRYR
jgi:hypothetical protein